MLFFIRHGETDFNQHDLWMGCTDIDLNENGKQQALIAAKQLADTSIDIIYTSPLKRAYITAQTIAKYQLKSPQIIVLEELRERGFGILEGTPRTQPLDDNFDHIEGVETKQMLIERLANALQITAPKNDENTLIVSHGGVFHCLTHYMNYTSVPEQNTVIENCKLVQIAKKS